MENQLTNSNLDTNDITYASLYAYLFNNVLNGYKIIFYPDVSARIRNLRFDFSEFESHPLTHFVTKNETGKILINGSYYKVDQQLFRVLNIAAFEYLSRMVKKYELVNVGLNSEETGEAYRNQFIKSIKKELKQHYNFKRVQIDANHYEFSFINKQDYVNSCINSAILNACLLMLKDSTVYYDYAHIKPSTDQTNNC